MEDIAFEVPVQLSFDLDNLDVEEDAFIIDSRKSDAVLVLCESYLRISADDNVSKHLRALRYGALGSLLKVIRQYECEHLLPELITAVAKKKSKYIEMATSKAQMKEILAPSICSLCAGKFVPVLPYHVEEEELLIYAIISPNLNLQRYVSERYMEVFERHFPLQYSEIIAT